MVPRLLKRGRSPVPLFVFVCRAWPLVWSPSPVHFNIYTQYDYEYNTSLPPQEKAIFGTPFVALILTPRSPKSGYGLLLGCRSSLDED